MSEKKKESEMGKNGGATVAGGGLLRKE